MVCVGNCFTDLNSDEDEMILAAASFQSEIAPLIIISSDEEENDIDEISFFYTLMIYEIDK